MAKGDNKWYISIVKLYFLALESYMAQTNALIATLKQALKDKNMTYADVGKALDMSEANVKRQFASKRFTLDRLEAICQILHMELTDLFELYEDSRQHITRLTYEQEQTLVADVKLLLVAVSVRNRLTFSDILSLYHLTEPECIQCLAQLDRLKIIDLLPNNRIKLRISEDFRWLADGPIEHYFESNLQSHFLASRFTGDLEQRLFMYGLLSETSMQQMIVKMQLLAKEFTELQRQDVKLPLDNRHSVGFMLNLRPWDASVFQSLTKK